MKSIRDILDKFDPFEDKYVSREYQAYGVNLAQKLGDERHKSMYIKFAKTIPRPLLDHAMRFVSDANAKSKAALFMWKLKELGAFKKSKEQKEKSKESNL